MTQSVTRISPCCQAMRTTSTKKVQENSSALLKSPKKSVLHSVGLFATLASIGTPYSGRQGCRIPLTGNGQDQMTMNLQLSAR